MLLERLKAAEKFYIYGAQVVAYGAYKAIKALTGRKPECFLVSSPVGNPLEIESVPVRALATAKPAGLVVVAVTELLHGAVRQNLCEAGCRDVFLLTQAAEHKLMGDYFAAIKKFPLATEFYNVDESADEEKNFVLYEVRNHRDKPLSAPPSLQPYERSIQAGAALSEKRVTELTDEGGDSISRKNKMYCEMTATYWVWKNTRHPWTGIEHYRRHLLVTPAMLKEDTDAILPLPYLCCGGTIRQFRRFVSEEVLSALLQALKVLHPGEYRDYLAIIEGPYQYTYNLLCAKRTVFEDYCRWFFRITEYMELMGERVREIKETRALSYVAEVLTNIYFMHHEGDLNLRHAAKAIYV